jgi:hypothetical protein
MNIIDFFDGNGKQLDKGTWKKWNTKLYDIEGNLLEVPKLKDGKFINNDDNSHFELAGFSGIIVSHQVFVKPKNWVKMNSSHLKKTLVAVFLKNRNTSNDKRGKHFNATLIDNKTI